MIRIVPKLLSLLLLARRQHILLTLFQPQANGFLVSLIQIPIADDACFHANIRDNINLLIY